MNDLIKSEVKNNITDYCQAKGFSQNELARQTGISSATISKILNNNWDSIDDKLWLKLKSKLESVKNELFNTTDLEAVVNLCQISRTNHFMVGLLADTGVGKTTALKYLSRNRNTFYISYDKTMKPKQFFVGLLKEMGMGFEGTINEMVNMISEELNSLENPLVIIDEAGKITHTMILYLQVLRDKTDSNCGIVLAGMPYFKKNLLKFSDKQKEGYAEFFRRINLWHQLNGLSRSEIAYICESNQITNKETIKELQNKKRFGDLMNAILLQKIIINN